ncbi:hypothetical protein R3P38DRAFT_3629178 [Favolaschia claudopus]|uniref:Uncharacterized protein n=1 Tax=Favolaschia claudopus TaxID=2862362 RepID=A0AAV9ZYA4_9AGAR
MPILPLHAGMIRSRVDAAEHLARPLSLLHAFSSRFGSRLAVFTFQHPSASLLVFQGLIFIKFSLRLQILEYLVSSILYTLSPYDTILRSILRSSASYHLSPATILMISVLIGWPTLTNFYSFRIFLAINLCRWSCLPFSSNDPPAPLMLYWHWYCKTTTAIQPFVNLHLMRGFQLYLFQPDADLRSYPAFPTLCDDTSAPTPTRSGSQPCTHSPYCHNPLSSSAHDVLHLPRHISSLTSPTYVSFRLRTALLRVLRTLFVTSLDGHPLLACEAYPRLAYGALTHVGAHPSSSPHLTPLGFASCDDLHLTLRDGALLPHATASSSSCTRRRPHPPSRDGVLILTSRGGASSASDKCFCWT